MITITVLLAIVALTLILLGSSVRITTPYPASPIAAAVALAVAER